ncbi:MAG: hypothetical protein GTO51_04090 [Candidatus Latescibacteria bacterium]|nr:hypothetical protein [Candidatus Latescibacterota bacterium]NIM21020.1 hypothetical protein [Candidatus Latescibacterota bacterium]NIM65155.1 hypothetical protein [Candidatus Latescibacterota bacterium]NIO01670.1 hypothetical protein [Candidatus Latescibacterota bacterium]NIO28187.1 hypothetical protein [Candidatus Latescibacterota bacterium]
MNDRLLERNEYEINYQRGLLRITTPIGTRSVVRVSYTRLPVLLQPVYSLREVEFGDLAPPRKEEAVLRPKTARASMRPLTNLHFGGTKSVSFSFGSNRGASLDQTLKATIEGNLTQSIKVKALLSDNNLPIQPEGNTEELEQLDKVYVEISSDRGKATLGDFTFANSISKYSTFSRELKGISTEVRAAGSRFSVAGASSKGVFRSLTFRGRERLQGPYELLSPGRLLGEVILAGTEKVYLDGELLRRGKNRDYTIDYDKGSIMFTPARLITADSEIAVDFEVSQEQYERTTILTGVETDRLPGGLSFRFLFARERDDQDRPRAAAIGEEERQVLLNAGDDLALARTSGITQVAPGEGEYVLLPADTIAGLPPRFVFDDSLGSFRLSFIETGVGRGDYVLGGFTSAGTPIYEFEGEGEGNYVVGKQLPLPESRALFTGRLLGARGKHLAFDLEWNVSDHDRNLFSDIDDGDNLGDAGEFRLQLKDLPVRIGSLNFNGSVSTIHERFRSLDKARTWYFYRDWNLENVPLQGREVLGELRSGFARGEVVDLGYSLGNIDRDNFSGMKHEGTIRLARVEDQVVKGKIFTTDVEGSGEKRTRKHGSVSMACGIWELVPSITYSRERFLVEAGAVPDSGRAYELVRLRLAKRRPKNVSFSIDFEERNTEDISETLQNWEETRRNRTLSGVVSSKAGAALRGDLQVIHRTEEDLRFGNRTTSDLARLKGLLLFKRVGLRMDVDYEISQNQTRTLNRTVVFVGEGKGDFNAQGEPVGKGKGDYTLVFLPTTSTIPTRGVDLTLRLTLKGTMRTANRETSGGLWSWVSSNVSLEQTVSVKEETTFDPAWKIYLLVPSALQRDNSTLFGITSFRQDWSLLDGYKNVSLAIRYQREDEEENRFQGVKEERFFEQQSIRLDRSISQRLTTGAELEREVKQRGGQGIPEGTGSSYDVLGWAISGGVGLRFSTGSTADIDVEATTEEDSESGAGQDAISLKPRFLWRIARSISLFGRYELTRFSEQNEGGIKPIFFSSSGNTHRWSLTHNVRLSKMISLIAAYQGRSEKTFTGKRVVDHDFNIETRAYF